MRVQAITVCPDRVDVIVGVSDREIEGTTAAGDLSTRALALLPALERHTCVNELGRSFAEEIHDTELPHLFEHVVIELMARAGSSRTLRGRTSCDFRRDGHNIYRVSLEYEDDLVCLGAVKAADRIMRYLNEGGEPPDIDAEVVKLRSLWGRPHAS